MDLVTLLLGVIAIGVLLMSKEGKRFLDYTTTLVGIAILVLLGATLAVITVAFIAPLFMSLLGIGILGAFGYALYSYREIARWFS